MPSCTSKKSRGESGTQCPGPQCSKAEPHTGPGGVGTGWCSGGEGLASQWPQVGVLRLITKAYTLGISHHTSCFSYVTIPGLCLPPWEAPSAAWDCAKDAAVTLSEHKSFSSPTYKLQEAIVSVKLLQWAWEAQPKLVPMLTRGMARRPLHICSCLTSHRHLPSQPKALISLLSVECTPEAGHGARRQCQRLLKNHHQDLESPSLQRRSQSQAEGGRGSKQKQRVCCSF